VVGVSDKVDDLGILSNPLKSECEHCYIIAQQ